MPGGNDSGVAVPQVSTDTTQKTARTVQVLVNINGVMTLVDAQVVTVADADGQTQREIANQVIQNTQLMEMRAARRAAMVQSGAFDVIPDGFVPTYQ